MLSTDNNCPQKQDPPEKTFYLTLKEWQDTYLNLKFCSSNSVLLNLFSQQVKWAVPSLSARWIRLVVLIWEVWGTPSSYAAGGKRGHHNVSLQGKGDQSSYMGKRDVARPCRGKEAWPGPYLPRGGEGHGPAPIHKQRKGAWPSPGRGEGLGGMAQVQPALQGFRLRYLAEGRVVILMFTAPPLSNFWTC